MNTEYTVLPAFYDKLNCDVDYSEYADYILRNIPSDSPSVLDLGCGTGNLSIILSKRGADVVGLDNSSEMLALAAHKAKKENCNVFLTCQDMAAFSTGRSYDAIVSIFDCLNYVKTKTALFNTFKSVSNELNNGGIFLFDMNTEYKFETVYADNSYVLEEDGVFCAWQNYYDKNSKICDFYINIFAKNKNVYDRYYEEQTERMFTLDEIKSGLKKAGLTFVGAFSDYNGSPLSTTTERYYIIARK